MWHNARHDGPVSVGSRSRTLGDTLRIPKPGVAHYKLRESHAQASGFHDMLTTPTPIIPTTFWALMLTSSIACDADVVSIEPAPAESNSEVSDEIIDACETSCEVAAALECRGHDMRCVDHCLEDATDNEACSEEFLDLFECYTREQEGTASCLPDACTAEQGALFACSFPGEGCVLESRVVQKAEFVTDAFCADVHFRGICEHRQPLGVATTCTCLIDDAVVGTCEDRFAGAVDCCIQFFSRWSPDEP